MRFPFKSFCMTFCSTACCRWQQAACLLLAAACMAFSASTAMAQSSERNWHVGIALGQGERSNPLVSGEDIDIHYVVDAAWYGERFFFDNGDLGFTLFNERTLSVNAILTYNNERNYYNYLTGQQFGLDSLLSKSLSVSFNGLTGGTKNPEADITDAQAADPNTVVTLSNTANSFAPSQPVATLTLGDLNKSTSIARRSSAINGGLEFLLISPYGDLQAQVLQDVSSTHKGQEAWLSWSYPWYTQRSEVTLTLGLEWKSTDLIGYYFGVEPSESFPGRAVYQGDSGTNSFVRLAGRYQLSQHWTVVGMLEREQLSSAITASPIVTNDHVNTFFTGLFYAF
jgi:MipA family protein